MDKYRLKQLLAWVLLKKLLIVNAIDVTPLNPKKFDTVILSANASGHNSVQWDKDTGTLTTCFIGPNVCSALNNFPGATAAVNTVTVESTITINSANETLHGGHYEATGSTPIDVIVNTLPVTIDWTAQPQGNLTSAASATWTARINCVYPASEINVNFTVYVEGVKEVSPRSPTLTTVPDSNCDSLEETVVAQLSLLSSDIQQFLNQKIYFIANASHASFPNEPSVTSVQSAEAIFQGVRTSTPTPITKPPPDKKYCIRIPDVPCGIIESLIAIGIVIAVMVALVWFILHRRKNCKKRGSEIKREKFDKSKNSGTTNERGAQEGSTAIIMHEDSAKRRDVNLSVSSPDCNESHSSATDKGNNRSYQSTDNDLQQHKNVSNNSTNTRVENGKKEEGANRRDDNASISTSNYRESQFSANDNRVNKSPESMVSIQQNESLANNVTNIGVIDDKNGLKSKDTYDETNF